jgi:hypothetical protein
VEFVLVPEGSTEYHPEIVSKGGKVILLRWIDFVCFLEATLIVENGVEGLFQEIIKKIKEGEDTGSIAEDVVYSIRVRVQLQSETLD